jgi:catechol 2,3-dioxygenase-like lactoylglutathione lyase family enzyme
MKAPSLECSLGTPRVPGKMSIEPSAIMTSGIHHVTLITRRVQANVDFYVRFLGLRLVKRTGGYEDSTQLHLFYGDAAGSPGSLVTFLVWEDGAPGRVGNGQVAEVAFAVLTASIGHWLTRALDHRVPIEGPVREFDESVLRLKDPDGVIVKLVGADLPGSRPWGDTASAIQRLRAVTILTDRADETAAFVGRFGYRPGPVSGNIRRMQSATDAVISGTRRVMSPAFRVPARPIMLPSGPRTWPRCGRQRLSCRGSTPHRQASRSEVFHLALCASLEEP